MRKGIPAHISCADVAPLGGDYDVMVRGYAVTVSLQPAQNGKVVGKAEMKLGGRSKVKGVYAYCGNSIYGIYENEDDIGGKARNYFFACPDRKSIMMIDGDQFILERKEPPVAKKGGSTNTLLSRDYEKCKDEAAVSGGRYAALFVMDEEGVTHVQMPKTVKRGELISAIGMMLGVL